jgi:predicted unusual protein kinase regulating ubiquinone biosynthesis (AarF/ABC1/UbiB family)
MLSITKYIYNLIYDNTNESLYNQNNCLSNKIGQLKNILESDDLSEKSKFFNECKPLNEKETFDILLQFLENKGNTYIITVESESFKTGSIGMIFKGVWHNFMENQEKKIIFKVKYYEIDKHINESQNSNSLLFTVINLLTLSSFSVFEKGYKDLNEGLLEELDFQREKEIQMKFHDFFKTTDNVDVDVDVDLDLVDKNQNKNQNIYVPSIIEELSNESIITSEYISSKTLVELRPDDTPKIIKNKIGSLLLEFFFKSFFHLKYVYTDIHPGNILYDLIKNNDPRIIIVDYGSVLVLNDKQYTFLEDLFLYSNHKKKSLLKNLLIKEQMLGNETDKKKSDRIIRLLKNILEPYTSEVFEFTNTWFNETCFKSYDDSILLDLHLTEETKFIVRIIKTFLILNKILSTLNVQGNFQYKIYQ